MRKKTVGTVRTLFADQTVIAVVRVVRIAQATVRVLKLQELVTVLARMACAAGQLACASRAREWPELTSICTGAWAERLVLHTPRGFLHTSDRTGRFRTKTS